MSNTFSIIRDGVLVDAERRTAEPTDILIKGDTILSVGPPGLEAPPDAALVDAADRALMAGLVNDMCTATARWPKAWSATVGRSSFSSTACQA
jgi:hypothetical protein